MLLLVAIAAAVIVVAEEEENDKGVLQEKESILQWLLYSIFKTIII